MLGQHKVDDKANESTAIPELRLLDVSGGILTIDALGCQKAIAHTTCDEKADCILQEKEHQRICPKLFKIGLPIPTSIVQPPLTRLIMKA